MKTPAGGSQSVSGLETVHWGILGTGRVAAKFCEDLALIPGAVPVAVGSRTRTAAERFGRRQDVYRRHAGYSALARDPEVEVVYIATPHALHCENTCVCLEAGKHVLCEKPLALNAREAETMIACARANDRFLMEAMWTRFFPLIRRLPALLREGVIGRPLVLRADFGYRMEFDPHSRVFDPGLGGGALLDVGVYPVALAHMLFGEPRQVCGLAQRGETGVDENSALVLHHSRGELAVLQAAVRVETEQEAVILGETGNIRIHRRWWRPSRMTVTRYTGGESTYELPYQGWGYHLEAAAVMDCLRRGQRECVLMPPAESLAILRTMDALRRQWGVRYPGEP